MAVVDVRETSAFEQPRDPPVLTVELWFRPTKGIRRNVRLRTRVKRPFPMERRSLGYAQPVGRASPSLVAVAPSV